MAGKKFLNPIVKIALCVIGMVTMGVFLYPAILSGNLSEFLMIVRLVVFIGFGYLLVQGVRDLLARSDS